MNGEKESVGHKYTLSRTKKTKKIIPTSGKKKQADLQNHLQVMKRHRVPHLRLGGPLYCKIYLLSTGQLSQREPSFRGRGAGRARTILTIATKPSLILSTSNKRLHPRRTLTIP